MKDIDFNLAHYHVGQFSAIRLIHDSGYTPFSEYELNQYPIQSLEMFDIFYDDISEYQILVYQN